MPAVRQSGTTLDANIGYFALLQLQAPVDSVKSAPPDFRRA